MGSIKNTHFTTEGGFFNIINGKERSSLRKHNGTNPSNLELLPDVPIASSQDVEDAVSGARAAFTEWSEVAVERRKGMLNQFVDALEAYADQFARLLTLEQGKPVSVVIPNPRTVLTSIVLTGSGRDQDGRVPSTRI